MNYKKGVTLMLKASDAKNRQLEYPAFSKVAKELFKPSVQEVIRQGDFIIATGDIILNGFTVEVKVDKSFNPKLDAKLSELAKLGSIGKDSKLELSVDGDEKGNYKLTASTPVVAAVLWKKPPKQRGTAKSLAATLGTDFKYWDPVSIPKNVIEQVENYLNR